jgi:hypothetical protein
MAKIMIGTNRADLTDLTNSAAVLMIAIAILILLNIHKKTKKQKAHHAHIAYAKYLLLSFVVESVAPAASYDNPVSVPFL